jgi:hypothetical protein
MHKAVAYDLQFHYLETTIGHILVFTLAPNVLLVIINTLTSQMIRIYCDISIHAYITHNDHDHASF